LTKGEKSQEGWRLREKQMPTLLSKKTPEHSRKGEVQGRRDREADFIVKAEKALKGQTSRGYRPVRVFGLKRYGFFGESKALKLRV
jgi:hypothetical protein